MADPIDDFFGIVPSREALPAVEDSPVPMGVIEEAAISEDVALVRGKLRQTIEDCAEKIPAFLDLASQMQEPEMIDSAAKMLTALSKLSTDLIAIDLKVLQESKKLKDREPKEGPSNVSETPGGERIVTETTAAEILNIINKNRKVPIYSSTKDDNKSSS